MKKWGILLEEFPKVDTNNFLTLTEEEVGVDEEIVTTIRRVEKEQKGRREEYTKHRNIFNLVFEGSHIKMFDMCAKLWTSYLCFSIS